MPVWGCHRPRTGRYSGPVNARSSRFRSRPIAVLALSSVLVGACSDGGGGESPDATNEVSANARAAAINVSLDDLPEGYGAIPRQVETEPDAAPLEGCVDDLGETVSEASSPTFRLQTGESLSFLASETAILADSGAGLTIFDTVQEQPALTCLSERLGAGFAELLPRTTTDTPLELAPDPDFPELGDASLRLAGEATLAREGAERPIVVSSSLVLVQTGDALTIVAFGGVLEPFSPELQRSVATAIADRQA